MDIIHYDPVCLNSLLYLMETQTAEIMNILGRPAEATQWTQRAENRKTTMNTLLWDDTDGLYYDYNFMRKKVRKYPFLTTFYPLWAGIASPQQAERVMKNLPSSSGRADCRPARCRAATNGTLRSAGRPCR